MSDENSDQPEQIVQKHVREAIEEVLRKVEQRRLESPEKPIEPALLLFVLARMLEIMGSEWGILERVIDRQEKQHSFLHNPHGENGITLKDILESGRRNRKWVQAGMLILLGLALTQIWNIVARTQSQNDVDKKLDQLILKANEVKAK